MQFSTDVRKLASSKPVYAVAGCGDLAVQKLRQASQAAQEFQGRLQHLPTEPQEIQRRVMGYYDTLTKAAGNTYENLAERGQTVLERVRRQESTEEVEARAKTTSQQAKATATSARKTASSAQQAAQEAVSEESEGARKSEGSQQQS